VNNKDYATATALARIGISITKQASLGSGWGWTMQNAKIVRDWDGPYPTPAAAIEAALSWLLEHARKGLLCHHVHPPTTDDACLPLDASCFKQEWSYDLN
jgi:hypothetical protein